MSCMDNCLFNSLGDCNWLHLELGGLHNLANVEVSHYLALPVWSFTCKYAENWKWNVIKGITTIITEQLSCKWRIWRLLFEKRVLEFPISTLEACWFHPRRMDHYVGRLPHHVLGLMKSLRIIHDCRRKAIQANNRSLNPSFKCGKTTQKLFWNQIWMFLSEKLFKE